MALGAGISLDRQPRSVVRNPVMKLICACCGGEAPAKKQWFNQDKGYGICANCFRLNVKHEIKVLGQKDALQEMIRAYGKPGEHHTLK